MLVKILSVAAASLFALDTLGARNDMIDSEYFGTTPGDVSTNLNLYHIMLANARTELRKGAPCEERGTAICKLTDIRDSVACAMRMCNRGNMPSQFALRALARTHMDLLES